MSVPAQFSHASAAHVLILFHARAAVRAADVFVVVSGTDGALPSVVAGLVETPVVCIPLNWTQ